MTVDIAQAVSSTCSTTPGRLLSLARGSLARRLTVACAAIGALALGPPPATARAADACPNAAQRAQQFAQSLAGCRAYEMVSPLDKGGFSVTRADGGGFGGGNVRSATAVLGDGDAIAYVSGGAFGDTEASTGVGLPYLSRRGEGGWSTAGLAPPRNPGTSLYFNLPTSLALSRDGGATVASTPATLPGAAPCATLLCPIVLYLRDNASRSYKTISRAPLTGAAADAAFATATPDLRRVLFVERAVLVPDAPSGVPNLYEWIDDGTPLGTLRLVGVDPGGQPLAGGSAAGQGSLGGAFDNSSERRRAISDDGRRIFFTSPAGGGGPLYVREDGARTVEVSASQRATPDPGGPQPAVFQTAERAHGAAVFFTSDEQLTDDASASAGQPDLYRYDVDRGELTDVSADLDGPAGVLGVVGASDDASAVYFVASAQLGGDGVAGQPNVYLWREDGTPGGTTTFVATLDAADAADVWSGIRGQQVSSDGRYLGLVSSTPLTEYDTAGFRAAYRYDAQTGDLVCVSCNLRAAASTASATLRTGARGDVVRWVSENGRVAFQTSEALVAQDLNRQPDVYLYEDGAPQLISTGKDAELSTYMGMDPAGEDVFFATRQQLVGADVDDLIDLYVARAGGGYLASASAPDCSGDACQGAPRARPELTDPGSVTFAGSGDLVPAAAPPRRSFTVAKLSRTAVRRFAKTGRVQLTVRLTGGGTVTARATGRLGRANRQLGTAKRTLTQKGTVTTRLTLRLSRPARAALRRQGRLAVRITVRVGGVAGSRTAVVRLQQPTGSAGR